MVATVAGINYEIVALREACLEEACRLTDGLAEAAHRALRRDVTASPGERLDEAMRRDEYLKRIVAGLQVLQSRCTHQLWRPTVTLRLARTLLPPLPAWRDQLATRR